MATYLAALALLPQAAPACAVCFGATDSPLGKGLHWGVFALLVIVTLVLAAFAAFAIYLVRRAAMVARDEAAAATLS
ncbi:MAG: hypothetical protein ACKVYV_10635 [Limisphaerales bacterium]